MFENILVVYLVPTDTEPGSDSTVVPDDPALRVQTAPVLLGRATADDRGSKRPRIKANVNVEPHTKAKQPAGSAASGAVHVRAQSHTTTIASGDVAAKSNAQDNATKVTLKKAFPENTPRAMPVAKLLRQVAGYGKDAMSFGTLRSHASSFTLDDTFLQLNYVERSAIVHSSVLNIVENKERFIVSE